MYQIRAKSGLAPCQFALFWAACAGMLLLLVVEINSNIQPKNQKFAIILLVCRECPAFSHGMPTIIFLSIMEEE